MASGSPGTDAARSHGWSGRQSRRRTAIAPRPAPPFGVRRLRIPAAPTPRRGAKRRRRRDGGRAQDRPALTPPPAPLTLGDDVVTQRIVQALAHPRVPPSPTARLCRTHRLGWSPVVEPALVPCPSTGGEAREAFAAAPDRPGGLTPSVDDRRPSAGAHQSATKARRRVPVDADREAAPAFGAGPIARYERQTSPGARSTWVGPVASAPGAGRIRPSQL
jgi:hypothetical protein